MSDTFEDHPGLHQARADALALMEALPFAYWMLLTKRPENVLRMVPPHWLTAWPDHIWIGTTVENQQCADHRIPALLSIPAKVRFLSCEPLLEEIQISAALIHFGKPDISWVICGGESGRSARPMHPDWARSLRDQCRSAGVPFHFKQWGALCRGDQITTQGIQHEEAWDETFHRIKDKHDFRELDGIEHNEVPT